MTESMTFVKSQSPFASLLEGADYAEVKIFKSKREIEDFIIRMVSYQPGWLKFLYKVRGIVAGALSLNKDGGAKPKPKEIQFQFTPGGMVDFFRTVDFMSDRYWIGEASDDHLRAYLGVVAKSGNDGIKEYYTVTIVHYHRWTAWILFNLIRPFHHIVVHYMGKYAAK